MSRQKICDDYSNAVPTGGLRVVRSGEVVEVEMLYPRSDGHPKIVEVGIECVRAADSIRVTYDFDRDGYAILQASTFEWDADDLTCDADWQEVAFVQAWGRQREASSEGMSDNMAVLEARVREARTAMLFAMQTCLPDSRRSLARVDAYAAAAEALGRARGIAECVKAVTACYPSTPKWPRAAFDVLDDALAALAALEKTT